MKELRKTCYLPRTAILSSRDNMCVNSAVKVYSGNALNLKCKQVRKFKECKYYYGAEKLTSNVYDYMDIEELCSYGTKSNFCPFYFNRNKKSSADIIFLPYNYIFESKFKKALDIKLEGSIVLIDEAHNMEQVCENAKTLEFSDKLIDDCIKQFSKVREFLEASSHLLNKDSPLKTVKPTDIKFEEDILTSISSYLKTFECKSGFWPNTGRKITPKELFGVFFEGSKRGNDGVQMLINRDTNIMSSDTTLKCITPQNLTFHIAIITKIEIALETQFETTSLLSDYIDVLVTIKELYENYQTSILSNNKNMLVNNYKFFLNDVEESSAKFKHGKLQMAAPTKIRKLFIYCMNPGFCFKEILDSNIHSLIITSGTLSPIEGMESELKCNFPVKLENTHVVDNCQINFSIMKSGLSSNNNKVNFKFDANSRNNKEMLEALGRTVLDFCKITPGGILVFFTAFNYMNTCMSNWASNSIISEIEKYKDIFKDMQNNEKNKAVIKGFKDVVLSTSNSHNKKGGIMFSVMRGTSSEGIDFCDDIARLVLIVGIPYPNLGDVKVQLKKEYLDEYLTIKENNSNNNMLKKLNSNDWYTQSATRAVNQAIGRVIRHIDDYGAMILIDIRYTELLYKNVFSKWLKSSAKIYDDKDILIQAEKFFNLMKGKINV